MVCMAAPDASIAQLGERQTEDLKVLGSIPSRSISILFLPLQTDHAKQTNRPRNATNTLHCTALHHPHPPSCPRSAPPRSVPCFVLRCVPCSVPCGTPSQLGMDSPAKQYVVTANACSLFSLSRWDMWEVMGGVASRMLHLISGEVLIGRAL